MRLFTLLIIVVPAIEIMILIYFGSLLGFWTTLFLIIATGVIGAYLAKQQGLQTLHLVQRQIQYGHPPGDALVEGLCIIVGGILLLTPGFITDIIGFYLLFPITRNSVKPIIKRWIRNRIEKHHL